MSTDKVVIIGGGPGGDESALVAAQLGAEVTVVDSDGIGGSAVLTDCVPSKTLIATAELMTDMADAAELGVAFHDAEGDAATGLRVDLARATPASRRSPPTSRATTAAGWRRRGCRSSGAAAASTARAGWSSTTRRTPPTRCWSPLAPHRAPCPRRCRMASGSSPGSRSTT